MCAQDMHSMNARGTRLKLQLNARQAVPFCALLQFFLSHNATDKYSIFENPRRYAIALRHSFLRSFSKSQMFIILFANSLVR